MDTFDDIRISNFLPFCQRKYYHFSWFVSYFIGKLFMLDKLGLSHLSYFSVHHTEILFSELYWSGNTDSLNTLHSSCRRHVTWFLKIFVAFTYSCEELGKFLRREFSSLRSFQSNTPAIPFLTKRWWKKCICMVQMSKLPRFLRYLFIVYK